MACSSAVTTANDSNSSQLDPPWPGSVRAAERDNASQWMPRVSHEASLVSDRFTAVVLLGFVLP